MHAGEGSDDDDDVGGRVPPTTPSFAVHRFGCFSMTDWLWGRRMRRWWWVHGVVVACTVWAGGHCIVCSVCSQKHVRNCKKSALFSFSMQPTSKYIIYPHWNACTRFHLFNSITAYYGGRTVQLIGIFKRIPPPSQYNSTRAIAYHGQYILCNTALSCL